MACDTPENFPYMRRQHLGQILVLRAKIIQAAHRCGLHNNQLSRSFPPLLVRNLPPPFAVIVLLVSSLPALAPLSAGVILPGALEGFAPLMSATTAKGAAQIRPATVARTRRKEYPALHATRQKKPAARLANHLT
jgi:hypothetical protein